MWEAVYARTFLFDRRLVEFRRILHRSRIYRSFP